MSDVEELFKALPRQEGSGPDGNWIYWMRANYRYTSSQLMEDEMYPDKEDNGYGTMAISIEKAELPFGWGDEEFIKDMLETLLEGVETLHYSVSKNHDPVVIQRLMQNKAGAHIAHRCRRGFGTPITDTLVGYIGTNNYDSGLIICVKDGMYNLYVSPQWKDYFRKISLTVEL